MRLATLTLLVVLFASLAWGEPPKPTELTLHPQPIDPLAYRYRLFPAEADLKSGNAAPILLRLPWEQTVWMSKEFPKLHEWLDRPLTDPAWKEAGGVLPQTFYDALKRAAYRRDAAWEYPIGEQSPYGILLPDVQGLRGFIGNGLGSRIRYHLTRGELDEAREGILVGLANSRHLSQTPFFVNQLVALAVDRIMLDRTAELIAQPQSPNLYWALSTLPPALVNFERAANFEATLFEATLPAVNDLDRPRDAKEWRKMASQLIVLLEQLQEIPARSKDDAAGDGGLLEQLLRRFGSTAEQQRLRFATAARAELPRLLNMSEEKVAEMSDDEVGIRWYVRMRLQRDQKTGAVLSLPPREAWPRLKELQAEIKAMREWTGGKGFDFFNPTSLYLSNWTLRRKIAALRIIEAVRHFAATHNGQLPQALSDIKDVSLPVDPLSTAEFQWSVDGKTATLQAPPLPTDAAEPGSDLATSNALEFRLTLE